MLKNSKNRIIVDKVFFWGGFIHPVSGSFELFCPQELTGYPQVFCQLSTGEYDFCGEREGYKLSITSSTLSRAESKTSNRADSVFESSLS